MSTSQSHYDVLGVRPDADIAAIKRAYYAQMKQYHPDNFISERRQLETMNDRAGLIQMDKKIEDAKKHTQRLNIAYDVLSDAERRARYDRERQRATMPVPPIDPEYYRRTVKSRPHRHSQQAAGKSVEEKFPLAILLIFLVVILVISVGLSSIFQFPDDYLALPTTDNNGIPVGSTDATGTAFARRPTVTPRPLDSFVSAGDVLFATGRYGYAVEQYTRALEHSPMDATIYYRRGLAYRLDEQLPEALQDFNQALVLDPDFIEIYRERGLLYMLFTEDDAAANARKDFERYAALGGNIQHPEVTTALDQLNATTGE